jgi:rubrerythrin
VAVKPRVIEFLYTETLPNGETLVGVRDEDAKMIRDGYACDKCGYIWGQFLPATCPDCRLPTKLVEIAPPVPSWNEDRAET